MPKVNLSGHIVVPLDDLDAVLKALPAHMEQTRSEAGRLVFEVTQDRSDPTIFRVYEKFVYLSAFNLHQHGVRGSAWGQVTARVERHYVVTEGDT